MSTHKPFITIGYFGVPGRTGGMTHLVNQNTRRPLCGQTFHPEAEYQWCYPHWQSGDPECERCKKAKLKLWNEVNLIAGRNYAQSLLRPKGKQTYPRRPASPPIDPAKRAILERVKNYLEVGGLFNPEMMDHDKVRDLIMDLGKYIETH